MAGGLRHLQRRLMYRGQRAPERLAWSVVAPRLPADRAFAAGMLVFGVPVDERSRGDRAVLRSERGATWADTPVGRFLLAAGDEVSEDQLDVLPTDEP